MKRIPSTPDWVEHFVLSAFLESVDLPTFCSLMSLNKQLFQLTTPMSFDKFGSCSTKRQKVALFARLHVSVKTTEIGPLFSEIFRTEPLCRFYIMMCPEAITIGNFTKHTLTLWRELRANYVLLSKDPSIEARFFHVTFGELLELDNITPKSLPHSELFNFEEGIIDAPLSQSFLDQCSARIGRKVELIK
jgi:hypothetical protein